MTTYYRLSVRTDRQLPYMVWPQIGILENQVEVRINTTTLYYVTSI